MSTINYVIPFSKNVMLIFDFLEAMRKKFSKEFFFASLREASIMLPALLRTKSSFENEKKEGFES